MKNKKLLVSAVAVLFSVSAVQATNITGVAGNAGVYNINPEKVSGDVGYRHYDNFVLDNGHVANLLYRYNIDASHTRDIETFVNLVNNRVNINGVVNTVRNGAFHNGHAVFISPNGMVVGATGVLNVGALSVLTPTNAKYNSLLDEYGAHNFANINNLSKLKQTSRNADVTINGTVLSRNGVTIDGSRVNVPGSILNGINKNETVSTAAKAQELFNALVNTNGLTNAATTITADNGALLLRSGNVNEESGIFVSGKVANLSSNETALTNSGVAGTQVTGIVGGNGKVTLYNKAGAHNVNGIIQAKDDIAVSNKSGKDLDFGAKSSLTAGKSIEIVNDLGTGHVSVTGKVSAGDKVNIVSRGDGGLLLTSTADIQGKSARLVNNKGEMGAAAGSKIVGTNGVEVVNKGENLTVNGLVSASNGDVTLYNKAGKLKVAADADVTGNGNMSIKNLGAEGMTLEGAITNNGAGGAGETAIVNEGGDLTLNGAITAKGNMSVKNQVNGNQLFITKNASINHNGDMMRITNASGEDGMIINGNITNKGGLYIYNENGQLSIGANADPEVTTKIANKDGILFINSRKDSSGVLATVQSEITNESTTGTPNSLAIKHQGSGDGQRGINLQGKIANDGETAINNNGNDMYVSGIVTSGGDLALKNNANGDNMTVASNAVITAGSNANIRHAGMGDATVNADITHTGRLNVITDSGKLNVGGKINSVGGDMTYIASRKDGTGVNLSQNFNATSNGEVLVRNISGDEGLRFEGTIVNNGGQTALVNNKGDMVVGGSIDNTGSGRSVVVSNNGASNMDEIGKLTAKGFIKNDGEVRFINRSDFKANKEELKVDSVDFKFFGKY